MRQLNLLPPERRQSLRRELLIAVGQKFVMSVLFGLLLVSGTGIAAATAFQALSRFKTESAENEFTQAVSEYRRVTAEIAQGNQLLETVASLNDKRVTWSDLIAQSLVVVPVGTTLQTLSVDGRSTLISFAGVAPTRQSLAEFEEQLRLFPWAASVDAPRDNLLQAFNPTFRFTVHVDPTKLTTPQP